MKKKMAILGPKGTHSEDAALYLNKSDEYELTEYEEIEDALLAAEKNEVDAALVPVENSLEGAINVTLDYLAASEKLVVARELIWPVHNALMAKESIDLAQIRRIYSHPQPISQCRTFLRKNCPKAQIIKVSSTAKAAETAADEKKSAAVCAERGGALHGLSVLAKNIEDNSTNCTRFFEVRNRENKDFPLDQKAQKSLVICRIDGRKAGALLEVLEEFAHREVNLTRIESRPARTRLGDYIFFFDIERGNSPKNEEEAVAAVKRRSIWLKFLGSFEVITAN